MGKSYTHLSLEERCLLQTQLEMGFSPAAIAAGLKRARSTITREMARNGWRSEPSPRLRGRPRKAGGYRSAQAQDRACRLAAKPRVERKLTPDSALFEQVVGFLRQGSLFQSKDEPEGGEGRAKFGKSFLF